MLYIMFDTNVFLSLVLPYHRFRELTSESLKLLEKQIDSQKIECLTIDLIRLEIEKIIDEISKFIFETFKDILHNLHDLDHPMTDEGIKEFFQRFNFEIMAQQDYKTQDSNRNMLLKLENYLLEKFIENPTKPKMEILHEAFNYLTDIKKLLLITVENYIQKFNIRKIQHSYYYTKHKEIDTIRKQLKIPNFSDVKILSVFIYYLQENNAKGAFLTHDFSDFIVKTKEIEKRFPEVSIYRPNYLRIII